MVHALLVGDSMKGLGHHLTKTVPLCSKLNKPQEDLALGSKENQLRQHGLWPNAKALLSRKIPNKSE